MEAYVCAPHLQTSALEDKWVGIFTPFLFTPGESPVLKRHLAEGNISMPLPGIEPPILGPTHYTVYVDVELYDSL
jgi:hypothetical protein